MAHAKSALHSDLLGYEQPGPGRLVVLLLVLLLVLLARGVHGHRQREAQEQQPLLGHKHLGRRGSRSTPQGIAVEGYVKESSVQSVRQEAKERHPLDHLGPTPAYATTVYRQLS